MRCKIKLLLFVLINFGLAGCYKATRASLPQQQLKPLKSASSDELIAMVNRTGSPIRSFQSSGLDINAEGRNIETNEIEEYKNVPAYIFLERPKNIRLKILIPVSRVTLFDMASNGEWFQIWYPRENKFISGRNNLGKASYRKGIKNTLSNLRPQHLADAVLLEVVPVNESNRFSVVTEDRIGNDNFYILEVLEKKSETKYRVTRRLWIERVDLRITRQVYFDDAGSIIRDIKYSNYMALAQLSFPSQIKIEQPEDKYSVVLTFRTFTLNKALDPDTFVLKKPPTAELIEITS